MAGSGPTRAPGEHIRLAPNAGAHVDAYFEYRALVLVFISIIRYLTSIDLFSIVGDDDGGQVFTPEEYEQYKKKVLPMVSFTRQRSGSRIVERKHLIISSSAFIIDYSFHGSIQMEWTVL